MTMKEYTWKWIWSDHGDTILSSHQRFPTKERCKLDALKHQPSIRTEERRVRTGHPKLELMELVKVEYRWMMSLYNDWSERIGRYSEDRWYDNWVECLNASYIVTPELFDPTYYWDMDFETRDMQ